MTNSNDDRAPRPQAEVAGDLDGAGTLNGRAGASVFSIGGPDGRGGTAAGANPYELLSASLAACTAMTIRLQARRRKIPLMFARLLKWMAGSTTIMQLQPPRVAF